MSILLVAVVGFIAGVVTTFAGSTAFVYLQPHLEDEFESLKD